MTLALAAALSLLSNLAVAEGPAEEEAPTEEAAEQPPEAPVEVEEVLPIPSTAYSVSDADSLLYVVLVAPEDSKAHSHVVKAADVQGSVTWGETGREISVSFPVSSLAPDMDDMRAMVGFEDKVKPKHQAKVKQHLLADNQLDGENFDTVRFTSSSITETDAGWLVKGQMEIHGQSADVETLLNVTEANGVFSGTTSFEIKGSDFGFEPYSKGPFTNSDTLVVHVKLAAAE
ncbi:MAG: hypothetical protein ACI9VR_003352 [Cognaticolwellia sp.]|jgi:hypothetical protein